MHVSSPPTTSRIKSNPIKNCKIQKLTFETREPGLLIHSISSFISPPELNDVLIARVQPHPPPHTQHTFVPTLEHRHQLSSVVDCFGKFSDINGSVLIFHIHTRVRFCGLNFHFHYCWRWIFPQNRNGVITILMRWNTNSSVHLTAVNGTWMELTLVFFLSYWIFAIVSNRATPPCELFLVNSMESHGVYIFQHFSNISQKIVLTHTTHVMWIPFPQHFQQEYLNILFFIRLKCHRYM